MATRRALSSLLRSASHARAASPSPRPRAAPLHRPSPAGYLFNRAAAYATSAAAAEAPAEKGFGLLVAGEAPLVVSRHDMDESTAWQRGPPSSNLHRWPWRGLIRFDLGHAAAAAAADREPPPPSWPSHLIWDTQRQRQQQRQGDHGPSASRFRYPQEIIKMGDSSGEVTEESRDASQEEKGQAMEAMSEEKLEEAVEHLTKAVLLNPTLAITYGTRGINDATVAYAFFPLVAVQKHSMRIRFDWIMLGFTYMIGFIIPCILPKDRDLLG